MPWADFEKNVAPSLVDPESQRIAAGLLAQAKLLLYEEGADGFPDYGAWVTWDGDKAVVRHSHGWKPKEAP